MRDGTVGTPYPIWLGKHMVQGNQGGNAGGASNWSQQDYNRWNELEAKRLWDMRQRKNRPQPRQEDHLPDPRLERPLMPSIPRQPSTNMPGVNMPGTNMPGVNMPGTNMPSTNMLFNTPPSWSAPMDQAPVYPDFRQFQMPGAPGTNMPSLPGAPAPVRRNTQYAPFYNQLFGQGYF